MRPSASVSETVSTSCTAVTRAVMIPTASSTDIIGPPKAKQSSDNCAISVSALAKAFRQHILDRYRGALHHLGHRLDIIEMGYRKRGCNRRIGCDADNAGIVGKQQRLAVGGAVHLDLAMRLPLETFDHDEIDRRHFGQQLRQPRLGGAPQLM